MDAGIPAEPEMIKFFEKKRKTNITTAFTTGKEPILQKRIPKCFWYYQCWNWNIRLRKYNTAKIVKT